MKSFSILLMLAAATTALAADPPPQAPPPAASDPADDALRTALEKAYAAEGLTNAAPRVAPSRALSAPAATAPAVPAPAAPAAATPAATPLPAAIPAGPPPGATSPVPQGWTVRPGTNLALPRAATNVSTAVTNLAARTTNAATLTTNVVAIATNLAAAATNRPQRSFQAPPGFPSPQAPPGAGRPPGVTPPAFGQPATGAAGSGGSTNTLGLPAAGTTDPNQEILPAGLIAFEEADLGQVLKIYQELTGRTILKPNSLAPTKITLRTQTPLTRVEAVQALDSILSMNGITMVPQGEKFVKAVAEAQAGQAGQQFNDISPSQLPEAGMFVTQVIQLTNASPNDLVPILQPFAKFQQSILTIPSVNMLVLRDYAENVKRMVEMIKKVDVIPQQEFESVVIPIKYALAGDIAQVLGSLTAGGGSATTIGGGQASRGLSGGGIGGRSGGIGGLGGAGGLPGQAGYGQGQFGQQQQGLQGGIGGQAGQRGSFQQRLQQIANRAATGTGGDIFVLGQTKIIADERINALLIFASKQDLVTISNIIDKLDVVLAQVLIEAVVMEVRVGNTLDYGFSYIQNKPATVGDFIGIGAIKNGQFLTAESFTSLATNSTLGLPGGFSYAASFMGLDAVVTAMQNDNRVRVLQRPRIQTSHAVQADIFVGETRPYPTTSYYGGGAFGGSSSIQQLQIGVTLSVLPLINQDGLVVMDIRQKVQAADGTVKIENVGDVPVTREEEANAKVAVRDGETVMLGGFISNAKVDSKSGVPILMDIPLIGPLFRSTKNDQGRRELVVLLRPTVLPTPMDASRFATEERNRLPSTRKFEKEVNESEEKLINSNDTEPKPSGIMSIFK